MGQKVTGQINGSYFFSGFGNAIDSGDWMVV